MKTNNMSTEILDSICDTYKDDSELVVECLRFLYYNTTNETLGSQIVDILSDIGYCVECGSRLLTYNFSEFHNELDRSDEETLVAEYCPICDKYEINGLKGE